MSAKDETLTIKYAILLNRFASTDYLYLVGAERTPDLERICTARTAFSAQPILEACIVIFIIMWMCSHLDNNLTA